MSFVVPAVLPKDKRELDERIELFAAIPEVTRIQIDAIDGKFVAPATWPYTNFGEFERMRAAGDMLPHLGKIQYEVDLMCLEGDKQVPIWLALGATRLIFHVETSPDVPRMLERARDESGAHANFLPTLVSFGISISIDTNLAFIESCLSFVEFVQFMGIARIGKQGQPFDERVLKNIRTFRARHPDMPVQVDGGVSLDSAPQLAALGVKNIVVGSALIKSPDPAQTYKTFEAFQNPYEA